MTTEELIKALREKESRDNRWLLDEAADQLEFATKTLVAIVEELTSARESAKNSQFLLLEKISSQRAEIEILQKKYEFAVAEREANVKGFTDLIERMRKDD